MFRRRAGYTPVDLDSTEGEARSPATAFRRLSQANVKRRRSPGNDTPLYTPHDDAIRRDELGQKIQRLRELFEEKEDRIQELECLHEEQEHIVEELKHLYSEAMMEVRMRDKNKATIRKLEGEKASLIEANRSMARTNEVLTALFAKSPAKLEQESDSPTPNESGVRGSSRPTSMLLSHTPSLLNPKPALRPAPITRFSPQSGFSSGPPTHLMREFRFLGRDDNDDDNTNPSKQYDESDVVDSSLEESCYIHSHPYRRKPRRFMAGSTQLKPLLLSTMGEDVAAKPTPSLVPLPLRPKPHHVQQDSLEKSQLSLDDWLRTFSVSKIQCSPTPPRHHQASKMLKSTVPASKSAASSPCLLRGVVGKAWYRLWRLCWYVLGLILGYRKLMKSRP